MTRTRFIELVKADRITQLKQCAFLIGLMAIFAIVGKEVVSRGDENLLRLNSIELWVLLGMGGVFAVAVVAALRLTSKGLLKCPHCMKCIGGLAAQVVVGSGRCGFCGGLIIDQD